MPSTPTEAKTLNLTALIERLENADGPSRELDRAIQCGVGGWHRVTPSHTRNKHGAFISPDDWIGKNSDGSPIIDSLHGTTMHRDVPAVTASIDAAVALATRLLPEMSEIHPRTYTGGKFHHCEIETDDGDFEASNCPNLALAICLATLRALEAKNG